jgi:hypothetical protein
LAEARWLAARCGEELDMALDRRAELAVEDFKFAIAGDAK